MPDELLTLHLNESPDQTVPCSRAEYYDQAFTTYVNHHPGIIDVFLFNKHGDILLQKRGRNKKVNGGKLHTTVGGHINWGEKPEFTLVHECMEELGAPVLAFPQEGYAQAYQKLEPYTNRAALVYCMGDFFRNYTNDPMENRRTIKDRVWVYVGRYDGPIGNPDRDSAGYEWMSLDVLATEFEKKPEQFTVGLKAFTELLGDQLQTFVKNYCRG